MRRLSDEGETVVLNVKVPVGLLTKIDEAQAAGGLRTRSDAVRFLLERGVEAAQLEVT